MEHIDSHVLRVLGIKFVLPKTKQENEDITDEVMKETNNLYSRCKVLNLVTLQQERDIDKICALVKKILKPAPKPKKLKPSTSDAVNETSLT